MNDDREQDVSQVFVSLAGSLAQGTDVLDMLSSLTVDCARLLDIASAGLLLADRRNVLQVVAASSERTRHLEILQLQGEQGPCLDCYRTGQPVSSEDLIKDGSRWPRFAEAATSAGFASIHALPMRLRDETLGALNLFGTRAGALNDADLRLGQAFADVASIALVHSTTAHDQEHLSQQLQGALDSRIVIEQAKGLLAQVGDIDMAEAFAYLRRYSRGHNEPLSVAAGALVSRQVPALRVVDYARAEHVTSGQV